jgi:hypothetical protein
MMTSNTQNQKPSRLKEFLRKAANYLLGYLLYAGPMVALVFLLFRIYVDLNLITSVAGYNKFQVSLIANWGVLLIGLVLLVGVGFSEDRLRKSIAENGMWKVLLWIYLATAAIWAVWEGVYYVSMWILL